MKPQTYDNPSVSESILNKQASLVNTISYTKQYPNMREFEKPWECTIQVNDGGCAISQDGSALQSEGFGKCPGLIIYDNTDPALDTPTAALLHINELDLNPKQISTLEKLTKNKSYNGIFLRGSLSRDLKNRIITSDYFNIKDVKINIDSEDIVFDSGNQHWAVVYQPVERKIYIDNRQNKTLLIYKI